MATEADSAERSIGTSRHSIPSDVLDAPVVGVNLMPGTLRDQLDEGAALFVFLRHFGCLFCRETVAELRAIAGRDPDFPPVLFFFMGTPTEGRAFLRRDWPEARAVSDPDGRFYEAFGVTRGGLVQMFRPAVWAAQRRARARGFEMGERMGDIWRMPGVMLVSGDRVVWRHHFQHAGDLPDFSQVPRQAASGP